MGGRTLSAAPRFARVLLGAAALLVTLATALAATDGASVEIQVDIAAAFGYLGLGLLGVLLTAHEPRNPAGWVLLVGTAGSALLPVLDLLEPLFSGAGPAGPVTLAVLRSIAGTSLFSVFTLGVLVFPDGRGYGRLGRALVPIAVTALAMLLVGAVGIPSSPGADPLFDGLVGDAATALTLGSFALILPLTALAAATTTRRRRAAPGSVRAALRLFELVAWINAVAFTACGAISMLATLPAWFGVVADQTGLVFAIAAWIGIVRYRLVDLRAMLARTLPYLVASILVIGVAAFLAAVAGSFAADRLGVGIGVAFAAILALVLRDQLQALANLVVYGRRVDPATERTMRLEEALRESHALLVTARDDERRRIRRDLHDGLGPTLAGILLGVESAERHLDDPERARAELARLHVAGGQAIAEVRRIVYALHPPALDSLGLGGAIRDRADRLGAASVEVAELPQLPDTIEIGIYLIALEAMKNAAVHAQPGSFWVRLSATNRIALEVYDTGPGIASDHLPGVGIRSMRERAAELGGTLDLLPRHPHGTLVRAEWKLPA